MKRRRLTPGESFSVLQIPSPSTYQPSSGSQCQKNNLTINTSLFGNYAISDHDDNNNNNINS